MAAFLALASAGHASPATGPADAAPIAVQPAPPVEEAWWRKAGDPVLAALIEQGLAADREAACGLARLHARDRTAAAKNFGATLKRLFSSKDAGSRDQATREAAVGHLAERRSRIAQDIALAYVELRRLQQIHTLRAAVLDQYKDNAQIAEFRRQAGLVSAIDGALAAAQDDTARAELGYVDGRLQDALAALAHAVGAEPAGVAAQVGITAPLPSALLDGLAAQTDNGREARLDEALEAARRAAKDARSAYREGAGNFTTLYVAEAAALSVEQALADARAQRAAATIRQWSARDEGWARADIALPAAPDMPAASSEMADCD